MARRSGVVGVINKFARAAARAQRQSVAEARARERAAARRDRESARQERAQRQQHVEDRLEEAGDVNENLSQRLAELEAILETTLAIVDRIDFDTWVALGISLSVVAVAALGSPDVWLVAAPAMLGISWPWQRKAWARLRTVLEAAPEPPLPQGIASLSTYRFSVVTVDARGAAHERRKGRAQYFVEDLDGGLALEMTLVPGGTFVMGSPAQELHHQRIEEPQHNVTLGPFFLGRYPVTQTQWRAVARLPKVERDLNADPSHFKRFDNDRPVEQVTWHEAVEFCRRLSRYTGREYRLPSETQWEYACRAGTTTPFHFGPTITPDLVSYDGNFPYGAAPKGQASLPTPVGAFGVANAFGLSDMHGNVLEWCQDIAHENYDGAPADGGAWEHGGDPARRILRGGAWHSEARYCRSAARDRGSPEDRDWRFGFRVVCAVSRTHS